MPDHPSLRAGHLRRLVVAVAVAAIVWIAVLSSYLFAAMAGDHPLPPPYNLVLLTTMATATVVLVIAFAAALARSGQQQMQRRLDAIHRGLVSHGVSLAEITGEIPRSPLMLNEYDAGYADGLAGRTMRPGAV